MGEWRLTLEERKRILLEHVYGVDIDPQAVEVTKLSLLLKLLEGEDRQTLDPQLALLPQRILPDLDRNIRCGNTLIGPEFYDGQMALLDEEEMYRVNVFDWQAAFPAVFAQGGFDGIVGNPPYVRIQAMKEWAPLEVEYYKRRYRAASQGNYDLYVVFVEQGAAAAQWAGAAGLHPAPQVFQRPVRRAAAPGHRRGAAPGGNRPLWRPAGLCRGDDVYLFALFEPRQPQAEFRFVQAHDLAAWRQWSGSRSKVRC